MGQKIDISRIDSPANREYFKRIQHAIDTQVAADNGGVPKYHLSLITGQSAITEHVVMEDGRRVPYSRQQQEFYDKAYMQVMSGSKELSPIPEPAMDVNVRSRSADPAVDYLDSILGEESSESEGIRF